MLETLKYLFSENSLDDMLLFLMLFALAAMFTFAGKYEMADRMATLFTGGALAYLKKK